MLIFWKIKVFQLFLCVFSKMTSHVIVLGMRIGFKWRDIWFYWFLFESICKNFASLLFLYYYWWHFDTFWSRWLCARQSLVQCWRFCLVTIFIANLGVSIWIWTKWTFMDCFYTVFLLSSLSKVKSILYWLYLDTIEITLFGLITQLSLGCFYFSLKQDWNQCLSFFSLLVFAQKRSNHILTILMALSFYSQVILSCLVFHDIFSDGLIKYWIGTAHPLVRLPVFFMGVCAGVLCIRIQQGDLDAFHSKFGF